MGNAGTGTSSGKKSMSVQEIIEDFREGTPEILIELASYLPDSERARTCIYSILMPYLMSDSVSLALAVANKEGVTIPKELYDRAVREAEAEPQPWNMIGIYKYGERYKTAS